MTQTTRRARRERIALNRFTRYLRHAFRTRARAMHAPPSFHRGGWYADRQGRGIDLARWSALFEHRRYRCLCHTQLAPNVFVSTIWEGILRIGRGGIFATAVFRGADMQHEYREHTEAAARERHLLACLLAYRELASEVIDA